MSYFRGPWLRGSRRKTQGPASDQQMAGDGRDYLRMAPSDSEITRAAMEDVWDPPSMSGPYTTPVDRFGHLPIYVRRYLSELKPRDVEILHNGVRILGFAIATVRVLRRLLFTLAGAFAFFTGVTKTWGDWTEILNTIRTWLGNG